VSQREGVSRSVSFLGIRPRPTAATKTTLAIFQPSIHSRYGARLPTYFLSLR
jgi:hypothetical protein